MNPVTALLLALLVAAVSGVLTWFGIHRAENLPRWAGVFLPLAWGAVAVIAMVSGAVAVVALAVDHGRPWWMAVGAPLALGVLEAATRRVTAS